MRTNYLFILGAMKAGTTTLFHHLNQHPEICRARKKEIDYFTQSNFDKNLETYDAMFDFDISRWGFNRNN